MRAVIVCKILFPKNLSKTNKEKILFHPQVYRPGGSFEVLLTKKNYQVKKLIINPQQKISLQKHLYRSENWIIVQGKAKITKNNKNFKLVKNQSISIPKKEYSSDEILFK